MLAKTLSEEDRKAALSFAWLAALSAQAGFSCDKGTDPDRWSIDAVVRAGPDMYPQLDIQLKATSSPSRSKEGLHFQLHRKNYDDLRPTHRRCPALLVVVELPSNPDEWLNCQPDRLTLRKCAWWELMNGYPPIEAGSHVIILPESQQLDLDGLKGLMEPSRQEQLIGGQRQ